MSPGQRALLLARWIQPIGSGFGAASTAAEVIKGADLTGRLASVTGGYSGIGLETTRQLAAAGATVIVPARDPDKAAGALRGMERVEQAAMDLLDPGSIDAFVATSAVGHFKPFHGRGLNVRSCLNRSFVSNSVDARPSPLGGVGAGCKQRAAGRGHSALMALLERDGLDRRDENGFRHGPVDRA